MADLVARVATAQGDVAFVPGAADLASLDGRDYGAARFVDMRAILEVAVLEIRP
jgi:hypothetical protein